MCLGRTLAFSSLNRSCIDENTPGVVSVKVRVSVSVHVSASVRVSASFRVSASVRVRVTRRQPDGAHEEGEG